MWQTISVVTMIKCINLSSGEHGSSTLAERGPNFLYTGENTTNSVVQKPVTIFQEDIRASLGHNHGPVPQDSNRISLQKILY